MRKSGTMLLAAAALAAAAASPAVAAVNTNSEAYWEGRLAADYPAYAPIDCTKTDRADNPQTITTTQDYLFVVVKGGTGSNVVGPDVPSGTVVDMGSVLNGGGQQAAISWIMTCQGSYTPPS